MLLVARGVSLDEIREELAQRRKGQTLKASENELKELLEFAVELARGAGDITLQYFRKQPETSTKSDGSYVTIADREAEAYLRKQIAERFPDDGILGEEEGESARAIAAALDRRSDRRHVCFCAWRSVLWRADCA